LTTAGGSPRILVIALGSTGDVNPMLGIAAGLGRRGHDVVFLANPVFAPLAAAAGLSFAPLGTAEDYEFIWDRRTWQWWRCTAWAFRHFWVPSLRPTYERIASLVGAGRAVLVANTVAPAAQLARERLGLPLAVVSPSPLMFQGLEEFPDYGPLLRAPRWLGKPGRRLFYRLADGLVDFWIAKGFNQLRSELGLPSVRRFFTRWLARGDRVIGLWPEWFAKPQEGWPSPLVVAGFLNYDRAELEREAAAPPVAGDGEAPIVFTCGSAMTHAGAFLEVASGVQEILDRRVVMVTDRPLDSSAPRSSGVQCLPYVPFRRILPRAAAVVHHGGIGTCSAALAAGIPQVIVPLAFDQFDNAERCERLGVARRVPRRRFRPRRVARVLRDLLGSKAVAERCRHWQAQGDSEGALDRVCEEVEGLADSMRADSTRA
jgi:UDP:flavonoid glycosyltransferase YjiC (YdhE family)